MALNRTSGRLIRFEPLECRKLFSVDLLLDAAGISATSTVTVNGTAFFFASNGLTGNELWKADADTGSGTALVKDLTPGPASSKLQAIAHAGDHAVFITVANEGEADGMGKADFTVWSSDGTAKGTVVLTQFLNAGAILLKQVGDRVAFAADTRSPLGVVDTSPLTDALLYFTDGTIAGTTLVKSFLAVNDPDPDPDVGDFVTYAIGNLAAAGDRLIFSPDDQTVWSSDGTPAGTIDLSPALGQDPIASSFGINMIEADGKVVMPGQFGGHAAITDGTLAGSYVQDFPDNIQGVIEPYTTVFANGGIYFVEIFGDNKTVWRLDIASGKLTDVFHAPGDASDDSVVPVAVGDRVFILDATTEHHVGGALYVLGKDGPTKVADFPTVDVLFLDSTAAQDGVLYYVLHDYWGDPTGDGTTPGFHRATLWRSDGTPGGTGPVRTLFDNIQNPTPQITLTPVRDKLAIKFTYYNQIPVPMPEGKTGYRYEEAGSDTNVYDPNELQIGRAAPSAKLLNGVLRLGGSTGDDNIRVWRSAKSPDRLVVDSNGNERTFPFNSIRKIIADLQSGNDYFQILEGEGGLIRLRTSIFGGDGMDTIITGAGRDTISGGNNGDLIRSRGNADEISGGAGKDRINAGVGDDQIAGGSGNDQIIGGDGIDVLFGQSALEAVFGKKTEGDDLLNDVLLS